MTEVRNHNGTLVRCGQHYGARDLKGLPCPGCAGALVVLLPGGERLQYAAASETENGKTYWRWDLLPATIIHSLDHSNALGSQQAACLHSTVTIVFGRSERMYWCERCGAFNDGGEWRIPSLAPPVRSEHSGLGMGALPPPGAEWMVGLTVGQIEKVRAAIDAAEGRGVLRALGRPVQEKQPEEPKR